MDIAIKTQYSLIILSTPNNLSRICPVWTWASSSFRSSHHKCSVRKGVLRNFAKFTGKQLCQRLSFNKVKKESLAQVFSCEFYKIFMNTFFTEHLRTTAPWKTILSILVGPFLFMKFFRTKSFNEQFGEDLSSNNFIILLRGRRDMF